MVVVVGHRGASGLAPENTLPSFSAAVSAGVDVVEFDVRETKDGDLVVIHDETVDRTTDGSDKVSELTLEEVKELSVEGRHEIPTLQQAVQFFEKHDVEVRIELKEVGFTEDVVSEVEDYNPSKRSVFISFEPEALHPQQTENWRQDS